MIVKNDKNNPGNDEGKTTQEEPILHCRHEEPSPTRLFLWTDALTLILVAIILAIVLNCFLGHFSH